VPPGKQYLPYQEKGIRYALGARGTIIADEMGLGKTVQAIGVINASLEAKRVLVVCPAGLVTNWLNEFWAWRVKESQAQVTVVSYHGAAAHIDGPSIDILIVDECHYVKNADTQRAQTVKALAAKSKRVLLLTGTPMENCPIELWPLLQIACPEKWDPPRREMKMVMTPEQKKSHPGEGQNFWEFAKRYCDLKKVRFKVKGRYRSAYDFSGASNLIELNARLKNTCMVRRLKKDVLTELPDKRRQLIVLKTPVKTADFTCSERIISQIGEINESSYFHVLKRLVGNKVLFEEWSKKRHEEALAKVDACLEFIGDAMDAGEKLIVFAHHQDVIDGLFDGIEVGNPGIAVKVTGKTHVADRGAAVKRFQDDPKCKVFVGSIGAAGVGITLTASSHVIFCELDPVPGRMSQAEDRAHRIGQKNMVLVQHLIADGSLCARMAKILVKKQEVLTAALDADIAEHVRAEIVQRFEQSQDC
jgi:SWI/SNF-related matrix-associated actin-dependent regulator 1 of chromatin subfamily A